MIEALYLHIPFCTSRCSYCDFATAACHDDAAMDSYADALSLQVRRASRAGLLGGVKTVYIGGGTPTHLGTRRLNSLVYLLSLSINLEHVVEFTVECNPESLTPQMAKDLFALGVNRFSIGAQSFDDSVLKLFGRAHDAAQIHDAVSAAKVRETDVSLDLICGAPGQTMAMWEEDLRRALSLGVEHISVYPLAVEDNTPLAGRIEAGELADVDEGLQADMMVATARILEEAGMQRYETSNYCRPGKAAVHNSAYWSGVQYLGLGAAAASMMDAPTYEASLEAGIFEGGPVPEGTARVRVEAVPDAASFTESCGCPCAETDCLSSREALLEDAMLAFRMSRGLSTDFARRACVEVPELAGALAALEEKGLIARNEEGWVSTERGWLMGNEVFGAIWGLA